MRHRFLCSSLLLQALLLALAPAALAANAWYVDGVNGSDNDNCISPSTACKTIGHAISLASPGDSIMVSAATYTENLTIGIGLKIVGADASSTVIDGGGVGIVMTIKAGASVTVTSVTIQHGSTCANGGGINNHGRLTVNKGIVSGNSAIGSGGGVYNGGTLKLTNTTISGNTAGGRGCNTGGDGKGGGIYNDGTLTLLASTINGNTASGEPSCVLFCSGRAMGGGVYNSGALTVVNSTITENSATASGKFPSANGGGVENSGGTVSISNSTVSGNSASGSLLGHGAGISGSATVQNSIISNNTGQNCLGTMTSNGYNLSNDNTCNLNGPGDLNNTEPLLGKLGNYGGPTQTIPEMPGSLTVDAGNPTGCTDSQGHLLTTDQRGYPRPGKYKTNKRCDMGAYERQMD